MVESTFCENRTRDNSFRSISKKGKIKMRYIKEEHFNKTLAVDKIEDITKIKSAEQKPSPKISTTLEGYVYIQSKSLWRFPTHLWKRRYFVLRNDCLYFVKDEKDKIHLDHAACIEIESDTGIYPEDNTKGKQKFYIRINQDRQNFILCFVDNVERNKWLSSLLTIITQKYMSNFKSGAYKSIKLNYNQKRHKPLRMRHSSFLPRRGSEDTRNDIPFLNRFGSLALRKAESMFNLNRYTEDHKDRKSLVAII